MIQTPVGGSGTGEFIYGRGIYGEESFRIRQGAGGSGTFALYCSSSFDRQFITHQFSDPTQGAVSYVNYSEDSRSNAYFGIGTNNPTSHLHVSGNIISTGDMRVGNSTVEISGSAGTISASGAISASDLHLAGGGNALLDIDGSITASGNISQSLTSTGSFGHIMKGGVNWDTAVSTSAAAAGFGSGGGGGSTNAAGSDTQVQFNDGGTNFGGDAGLVYNSTTNILTAGAITSSGGLTVGGNISASGTNHTLGGFQIIESSDSGSIAVSGSVKIQPQEFVPALSESRLYNVTSENGLVVDNLYFGTAGLTPAYTWVTLDDDGTSTNSETIFGVGSAVTSTNSETIFGVESAVTSTTYNMSVVHDTTTNGTRIHSHLNGVYKVTGNFNFDVTATSTMVIDIKVDGSDVHTYTAKAHSAVDPVERTIIYVGSINSGSYVTATVDGTNNTQFDAGSVLLVERLS